MGTRANIFVVKSEECNYDYESIVIDWNGTNDSQHEILFAQFDGYPSFVGVELLKVVKHSNDIWNLKPKQAAKLIQDKFSKNNPNYKFTPFVCEARSSMAEYNYIVDMGKKDVKAFSVSAFNESCDDITNSLFELYESQL